MLCQCTLDACLDSALECILFSEPRDGLTRLALGACMHRVKNGLISFFRLSLIIPYIFSTYAVNCCLNRSAGYFASTIDAVSGLPTIPPYPLVMPNPDDDVRAL